jgi:hypothetical protein
MLHRVLGWFAARARETKRDDRGTIVETVVITAGLAALAITVIAVITVLINDKVASISL